MNQRTGLLLITIIGFSYMFSGCVMTPYACFSTDSPSDSLRVNQPVVFDPYCSVNAKEYFWQFNDNPDSIEFTFTVSKTFYDTGQVKVSLMVANGKKTSALTRYYQVVP